MNAEYQEEDGEEFVFDDEEEEDEFDEIEEWFNEVNLLIRNI
jgi:hypothetical protein